MALKRAKNSPLLVCHPLEEATPFAGELVFARFRLGKTEVL